VYLQKLLVEYATRKPEVNEILNEVIGTVGSRLPVEFHFHQDDVRHVLARRKYKQIFKL